MKRSRRTARWPVVLLSLAALAGAGLASIVLWRGEVDPLEVREGAGRREAAGEDPPAEQEAAAPGNRAAGPGGEVRQGAWDFGRPQPIPADANPHVRSVAEALRTGEHPERVSPLVMPEPFDEEAFFQDPQAYLNVVEPGRVWQTAQPGPDVPRLRAQGSAGHRIEFGQSVPLRIQAAPGAPVTFTSFDAGSFENRLTSITVQADERGVAQATFTASSGTLSRVRILAASPMAAGQVEFLVRVEPSSRAAGPDP